jgi:hypothetical protein
MSRKAIIVPALIAAMSLAGGVSQAAQEMAIKNTFVHLAQGVPAVLYEPVTPGTKSQIAVFVMHGGDYLAFSACTELSKRGYRVLCVNPSGGSLDKTLLEAKLAVTYLRAYPGIRKVVLFGHSGGATPMTAYQDIAENGVKVCQSAEKIHKCPGTLAGLPKADGVMLPDANFGNGEMTLFSIDPAVINDDDGMTLNPDLDMYNPKNGFKPEGSDYSQAFIHKFLSAEGERNNRILKRAQDRLAAIEAHKGHYVDDEPFDIAGAAQGAPNNKLYSQDVQLLSHTQRPWTLVRPDGSTVTQIVHTVRPPEKLPGSLTDSMDRGTLRTTVRNYLANSAIRADADFGYDEDSIHGVEWNSTYASPPGNVEGISVPLLAMGMTGHWEYLAAETIYDHARSADKSIAFVEGASHMYATCHECEKTPGQYGDTVKTLYDYIDGWLSKSGRFIDAAQH